MCFRDSLICDQKETTSRYHPLSPSHESRYLLKPWVRGRLWKLSTVVYCTYSSSVSTLSNDAFPFGTLLRLPWSGQHNDDKTPRRNSFRVSRSSYTSMPSKRMHSDVHNSRYFSVVTGAGSFDPARSQVKNYIHGSPCGPALCPGYTVTFVVIRVTPTG